MNCIMAQEKKEMLEDALSKKRRKSFEAADKKARPFVQKYQSSLTADIVIKFLMDAQRVRGPFPISKTVPKDPSDFRL